MTLFGNPCPVCGADDEHESWRGAASPGMVYAATFCPHPGEPGHGTGCCCAGRSTNPFSLSIYRDVPSGAVEAIGAQQALERRVAELEAGMERLMLHLNLEPEFLQECRIDVFHGGSTAIRLTHLPTGVKVDAPTKAEAASLLAAELEKRNAACSGNQPGEG